VWWSLVLGCVLALGAAPARGETLRLQKGAVSKFCPGGYQGISETYIDSEDPDRNYGLDSEFTIGSMKKDAIRRGLMRWDLTALQPLFTNTQIVVVSAELKLGLWYNGEIPDQRFDIYRLKEANVGWQEGNRGSADFTGMITWNSAKHGQQPWAGSPGCGTPGIDFDPAPALSFVADRIHHMRPRYLPPVELPVEWVRSWALEPEKNAGLLIKRREEPVNDKNEFVFFISSEHMRQDHGWHKHHPELIITYFDRSTRRPAVSGQLVTDGASSHIIVVPDEPQGSERYAAQELAEHLTKIAGCGLPVLRESKYTPALGPYVSVGRTRLSEQVLPDTDLKELGEEGYVIDRRDENLFVVGGHRRGTLYGVYTFLEGLGVRWFTPTFSVIPDRDTLPLPTARIREIPKVFYRDQLWNNDSDPVWRCRMRLNGEYARLPEQMGGSTQVRLDCHSYHSLISPEEFQEHPRWFALKEDGRRNAGGSRSVELCGTNPELRQHLIEKVRADLRAHPNVEQYWVSQDDGHHSGCFCDTCTAERVAHGGVPTTLESDATERVDPTGMDDPRQRYCWSANAISLANHVARGIRDEFPRVKIKVLAYSYTWMPPGDLRLEDNVLVVLCGPAGDWFLPYADSPKTQEWRAALRNWTGLGGNVQTYMYGGSNYGYWWPFPTWFTMCKNYRTAYEDGVRAMYRQGAASAHGSEFCELRAYLTAKCAWDPERDWMTDVVEFTDAYYGAGARHIRDYMTWFDGYLHEHNLSGHHYWGETDGWRRYVPDDYVATAEPMLEKALAATADDATSHSHVRAAYLPVLFVKVMQATLKNPRILDNEIVLVEQDRLEEMVEGARLFAEIMTEHQYNRWAEHRHYDPARNVMAAFGTRHRLSVLRNSTDTVHIAPTLGGRIVRWDVGGLGKNILHLPGSEIAGYPYGGGYEEYSQYERSSAGPAAQFEVKEANDQRVSMEATLTNGLSVRREFALSPDAPRLSITSAYTNATEKPVEVRLRNHPEFDYETFSNTELFAWQKPGTWTGYPMIRPGLPEGEISLKAAEIAQGTWLLGNTEANWGLLNTFELACVDTLYAFHGKNFGCVNLELWGRKRTLAPGESARLDLAFEYVDDLKGFLETKR
jgi:uncharacterized protein DUF4838/glycosyl hydrolase family 67